MQIEYFQEGIGHGGVFQIGLNCQLEGIPEPSVRGSTTVGWVPAAAIVTIQARILENASGFLKYRLSVNHRDLPWFHTRGSEGTPKGVSAAKHVGDTVWLLYQSFTASGSRLVRAGCKSPTSLEISGPPAPSGIEATALTATITIATVARWATTAMGILIIILGISLQSRADWSATRFFRSLTLGFTALVLGLASAAASLRYPEASKVIADLATAFLAVTGAWWLRYQIALVVERISGQLRHIIDRSSGGDHAPPPPAGSASS